MGRATAVIAAGFVVFALAAMALFRPGGDAGGVRAAHDPHPAAPAGSAGWEAKGPASRYPGRAQIRSAQRFAATLGGSVSFAVIGPDRRAGRATTSLHGRSSRTQFSSASVSKAMLLAAYLRSHQRLSPAEKAELESMIEVSDNAAADAVYAQVGDAGLRRVAHRAGMRDFEATPGFWGGAQISAADMARFFYRLEDNLGDRHQRFGMKLLAGIVSYERWGIPAGAGRGWSIWFKGGWRPAGEDNSSGAVSHQAALLRYRDGTRVAIAVLTDQVPGEGGGYSAIEGIAERLLDPAPGSGSRSSAAG
jgi:beta-lactamase class A